MRCSFFFVFPLVLVTGGLAQIAPVEAPPSATETAAGEPTPVLPSEAQYLDAVDTARSLHMDYEGKISDRQGYIKVRGEQATVSERGQWGAQRRAKVAARVDRKTLETTLTVTMLEEPLPPFAGFLRLAKGAQLTFSPPTLNEDWVEQAGGARWRAVHPLEMNEWDAEARGASRRAVEQVVGLKYFAGEIVSSDRRFAVVIEVVRESDQRVKLRHYLRDLPALVFERTAEVWPGAGTPHALLLRLAPKAMARPPLPFEAPRQAELPPNPATLWLRSDSNLMEGRTDGGATRYRWDAISAEEFETVKAKSKEWVESRLAPWQVGRRFVGSWPSGAATVTMEKRKGRFVLLFVEDGGQGRRREFNVTFRMVGGFPYGIEMPSSENPLEEAVSGRPFDLWAEHGGEVDLAINAQGDLVFDLTSWYRGGPGQRVTEVIMRSAGDANAAPTK